MRNEKVKRYEVRHHDNERKRWERECNEYLCVTFEPSKARIRDKCGYEKDARVKDTWVATQVYIEGAYWALNHFWQEVWEQVGERTLEVEHPNKCLRR